ncbi:hypothetical protein NDU88_001125 [Pleurodeles waltl]|uniref:Uncharacterized protein n=1 Tax=Pleurodeles waltl TaxID=8319 RepID=A0AAV7Q269_PLEWA|nr:hypothetical protein NDU88_001125 [Pleurodeles waltl]
MHDHGGVPGAGLGAPAASLPAIGLEPGTSDPPDLRTWVPHTIRALCPQATRDSWSSWTVACRCYSLLACWCLESGVSPRPQDIKATLGPKIDVLQIDMAHMRGDHKKLKERVDATESTMAALRPTVLDATSHIRALQREMTQLRQ